MPLRHTYPFRPVEGSSGPSFMSTANLTSSALALQSTALNRIWAGPTGRSIRLAESSGVDYFINFGSSTVVANSSEAMKVLGGTVETFHMRPKDTHIAVASVSSSTAAEVNITLGYGE